MADKKISALTAASTPLAGTEVLPIVQGGVTVKVPVSDLTAGRAVSVASLQATTGAIEANTSTYSGASLSGVTVASKASTDLMGTYPNGLSFTLVNGGSGWPISITQGVLITYYSNTYGADGIGFSFQEFSARNPSAVDIGLRRYFRRYPVSGSAGAAWSSWQEMVAADTSTGDITNYSGNYNQGTAGKGIKFYANTPAAGVTSQLLNWYEEGAYTATRTGFVEVLGSGTITSTGKYTRIGRQVTVNITLTCTGTATIAGNGGAVAYFNVPFTASDNFSGTWIDNTLFNTNGAVVIAGSNMFIVTAWVASGNSRVFTATYFV
jgi:hypothetical protein